MDNKYKDIPREPGSAMPHANEIKRYKKEGYDAYKKGLKRKHCPYNQNEYAYNIWNVGYSEAEWDPFV